MQYCAQPGCPTIVPKGRCAVHVLARTNVDVRRWYRTARWRRLRAIVLSEEPTCMECLAQTGRLVPTTDVDHKQKHDGDPIKFWNRDNLQGLCHAHHAQKTRRGQ